MTASTTTSSRSASIDVTSTRAIAHETSTTPERNQGPRTSRLTGGDTVEAAVSATAGVRVLFQSIAAAAQSYGGATVTEVVATIPASSAIAEGAAIGGHVTGAFLGGLGIGYAIHKGVELATGKTIGDHLCDAMACDAAEDDLSP